MSMWWQLALSRSFTFGQVILLTAHSSRLQSWGQMSSMNTAGQWTCAVLHSIRRLWWRCKADPGVLSGRSAPDSNTRGRSTETLPSYPLICTHKFNYTKYPADDYNMQSRPWPLCDLCDRIGPPNLGGLQIPDRNFFLVTISGVFRN